MINGKTEETSVRVREPLARHTGEFVPPDETGETAAPPPPRNSPRRPKRRSREMTAAIRERRTTRLALRRSAQTEPDERIAWKDAAFTGLITVPMSLPVASWLWDGGNTISGFVLVFGMILVGAAAGFATSHWLDRPVKW